MTAPGEDAPQAPSRESLEFMLVALLVADQWFEDRPMAVAASKTVSGDELAAGFISLFITLRRNLAKAHGLTAEQITLAIRRQVVIELGFDPGPLPAAGGPS